MNKRKKQFSLIAQYIKDLSFENPGVNNMLSKEKQKAPQVDLTLNVNVNNMNIEDYFEVSLHIYAEAFREKEKLFLLELVYAGMFHLVDIPEEDRTILLSIKSPELLFPFARKIVADITQSGGALPLMIDPIDFEALFQKNMEEAKANHSQKSSKK